MLGLCYLYVRSDVTSWSLPNLLKCLSTGTFLDLHVRSCDKGTFFINKGTLFINKGMLFINTELIFFNADLLLVTAGIKKFPPWDEKIPSLGLKRSQGGNFYLGQGSVFDSS